MNSYTIKYITGTVPWDEIAKAPIRMLNWSEFSYKIEAYAQLSYSDQALAARLFAAESNPLARFEGLFDMVSKDSCLEFFISPASDGRYFSFEFNQKGTIYLGFGRDRYNTARQVIPKYRELFSVHPFSNENGWGIDFSIPLSFMNNYFPDLVLKKGLVIEDELCISSKGNCGFGG
jgi:hypothetical protein